MNLKKNNKKFYFVIIIFASIWYSKRHPIQNWEVWLKTISIESILKFLAGFLCSFLVIYLTNRFGKKKETE